MFVKYFLQIRRIVSQVPQFFMSTIIGSRKENVPQTRADPRRQQQIATIASVKITESSELSEIGFNCGTFVPIIIYKHRDMV